MAKQVFFCKEIFKSYNFIRFCVLKDNFFLWYKEDDALKMKKSKYFNIKPQVIIMEIISLIPIFQGVIYLNNCIIREIIDNNQCCCFIIENAAFQVIFEFLLMNSDVYFHN